jgi:F-type H+-transporting ATPase subunit b
MAVLIAELVGFVVVLWVLYRFVLPPVQKMVKARQDTIQQQVEAAEAAAEHYREAEQKLESAIADARSEAARIRDDARADSTRIREELVEQAEREVERMRQRGEEQLSAQRDLLVRRLRGELGGQSMDLAERIVVQNLSDDASRSASVDTFLDELEAMVERDDRTAQPTAGSTAAAGNGGN